MTPADLAKARAHANTLPHAMTATAVWIEELVNEVESQERALRMSRILAETALFSAASLAAENQVLRGALGELYGAISQILKELK